MSVHIYILDYYYYYYYYYYFYLGQCLEGGLPFLMTCHRDRDSPLINVHSTDSNSTLKDMP